MEDSVSSDEQREGQAAADSGKSQAGKNEAPQRRVAIAAAKCVCCGEGMAREVLPRFNRGLGIILLLVGVLLSLFMSLVLGLPMVVIGAYLGLASRSVWTCWTCGAVVDRIGT